MQNLLYLFASFSLALIISLNAVPIVIRIALALKLMDLPNERSSAKQPIPTLGGIAIFLGFVFAATVGLSFHELPEYIYIVVAIMVMFFVGLKDDILDLPWWKKLLAQLLTASILVFLGGIRFTHLHGFMGIGEIDQFWGDLLTFFVIIVIINSFNLMDGIDGLAAGLSILAATVFGIWFVINNYFEYAVISFSLVGAIAGFFYFNVYGKKNKIFMGDTGSLILGTVMSVIVVRFNEFNIDQSLPYALASAPAVSFGILIYPLVDTIRVFTIRVLQFKSPFTADKNHLHHRLLTLGFSHRQATYTIISANILFLIPVLCFNYLGVFKLMMVILCISGVLFLIPAILIQKRHLIKKNDAHQQLLLPGTTYQLMRNRRLRKTTSPKLKVSPRAKSFETILQRLNLW